MNSAVKKLLKTQVSEIRKFWGGMTLGRKFLFVCFLAFISFYLEAVILMSAFENAPFVGVVSPFLLLFGIVFLLLCLSSNKTLVIERSTSEFSFDWKVFRFYLLISFGIFFVWGVIDFPGTVQNDLIGQWQDILYGQINDNKSAFHSFLFWLCTRVVCEYWFVVLIQVILFSLGTAYLCSTLDAWNIPRWAVRFCFVFILINPCTWLQVLTATTDSGFAVFMVFYTAHCVNIFFSEGKWLHGFRHIIYFVISFLGASLMRHNGIFATFPILPLLFFAFPKFWKECLTVSLLCVFSFIAIKGPLYHAVRIPAIPRNRVRIESRGLPLTVMSQVYMSAPDKMPETARALFDGMASKEDWYRYFIPGDFNGMKFEVFGGEVTSVSNISNRDFLLMFFETLRSDPYDSMMGFIKLTKLVWSPWGETPYASTCTSVAYQAEGPLQKYDSQFNLFKRKAPNLLTYFRNEICVIASILSVWVFGSVFWHTGSHILLVLIAALLGLSRHGIKVVFLIAPMILYDLGTMFLLTSGSDWRYFYFNAIVAQSISLVLFSKDKADR